MNGREGVPGQVSDSASPPRQQQQQPSRLALDRSSRQSPEGLEREFPATRIGGQTINQQHQHRSTQGETNMGGGDDRYYHSGQPSSNVRCAAGQLGQSRDFHYTVQDHHGSGSGASGYRSTSNALPSSGRASGSRPDTTSGYHHSPHVSTSSRSRGSRDYYLESKASPYHHGSGGGSGASRSGPIRSSQSGSTSDRSEYAILIKRQQAAALAAEYEHRVHHSSSRSDLLDHDQNSVIYEHGLSSGSPYGVPPQPQYTFVRMCDGKFVRTAMPLHDYESLDYRIVTHTLRPTRKRHPSPGTAGLGPPGGPCCPQVGNRQPAYATLRGPQKWSHRQKPGSGVGDNYGRSGGISFPNGTRSYTDEILGHQPNSSGTELHHFQPSSNIGLSFPSSKLGSISKGVILSRSTDRNLDNLGLDDDEEEEDDLDEDDDEDDDLFPVRTSDEALSLLTREPPDGKEKPEPIKTSQHKLENLSRKGSKCDLLPMASNNGSGNNSNMIDSSNCKSDATSICGDTSSVHSSNMMVNLDRSKGDGKRDSLSSSINNKDGGNLFADGILPPPPPPLTLPMSQDDLEVGGLSAPTNSNTDFRKQVPSSPRCGTLGTLGPLISSSVIPSSSGGSSMATSPKNVSVMSASLSMPQQNNINLNRVGGQGLSRVGSGREVAPSELMNMQSRSVVQYSSVPTPSTSSAGGQQLTMAPQNQQHMSIHNASLSSGGQVRTSLNWHQAIRAFVFGGTAKFFGVHQMSEDSGRIIWNERRRRLAIKRFGGIKDDYHFDGGGVYGAQQYDVTSGSGLVSGNLSGGLGGACSRLRYDQHLTSELEGDKMVLKITKPPRNKDSFSSLTGQTISWLLKSMMTRKVPSHHCVAEHDASRSYQPSTTGIAAYYQAEQAGGLAVCPPLPRAPSLHHLHGESPAEEVFFTKPTCDGDEPGGQGRLRVPAYSTDPYRSCSWQLPRPEADMPRMSSDVGASRIWNRLLDAAFDNSDRRKHGMGIIGRLTTTRRRATRRSPESNRKRKLGGNSGDHRPYFTYWMTSVQILVLFISLITYGIGPWGVDLYKKSGMVLVTNLELEQVAHLEPANFWIGPSVSNLIHLGAKYAPCMRWDEVLDREIREERLKERDTACCIRKDRAGCVQSPKTECSKYGDPTGSTPRSNWWRPSEWYSKYPNENRRSSGPVCGLDPAYCEAPASVAPYIWPDDITKWPICRRKTDIESIEGQTAEHMICEVIGHPCCIGIRGQCKITTKEYCMFVGGTFHEEAALCSQVSCLDDVCGLLPFRTRDVPDQFYRVWTPIFLHAGIVHLALTVALQYWLMRDLEKMAGAGRIALIYIGSGMVGNLASAIFVPYRAEVGPAGCHFGLLACCMVEVIHQWHMLKYPEMAILKLVGITAVFFLAGLLPWVDNYAHLFGFIFGFLLSYALLPYVTFGRTYDRRRKIVFIVVCLASVLFLFVGLLLLFYITPIHDCEVCKYFNCIPITKDFCADQNIDLRADV